MLRCNVEMNLLVTEKDYIYRPSKHPLDQGSDGVWVKSRQVLLGWTEWLMKRMNGCATATSL